MAGSPLVAQTGALQLEADSQAQLFSAHPPALLPQHS